MGNASPVAQRNPGRIRNAPSPVNFPADPLPAFHRRRLDGLYRFKHRVQIARARWSLINRAAIVLGVAFCVAIALVVSAHSANARGFNWFFAHIPPTGKCAGREVAVSFYWHGRKTASGERFDANGNTVAHRSLPFGTLVSFTNPLDGRTANARVNDRGPFGCGRMSCAARERAGLKTLHYDLAHGLARRLGLTQSGWVCVS
jgi:hypothetical protein